MLAPGSADKDTSFPTSSNGIKEYPKHRSTLDTDYSGLEVEYNDPLYPDDSSNRQPSAPKTTWRLVDDAATTDLSILNAQSAQFHAYNSSRSYEHDPNIDRYSFEQSVLSSQMSKLDQIGVRADQGTSRLYPHLKELSLASNHYDETVRSVQKPSVRASTRSTTYCTVSRPLRQKVKASYRYRSSWQLEPVEGIGESVDRVGSARSFRPSIRQFSQGEKSDCQPSAPKELGQYFLLSSPAESEGEELESDGTHRADNNIGQISKRQVLEHTGKTSERTVRDDASERDVDF